MNKLHLGLALGLLLAVPAVRAAGDDGGSGGGSSWASSSSSRGGRGSGDLRGGGGGGGSHGGSSGGGFSHAGGRLGGGESGPTMAERANAMLATARDWLNIKTPSEAGSLFDSIAKSGPFDWTMSDAAGKWAFPSRATSRSGYVSMRNKSILATLYVTYRVAKAAQRRFFGRTAHTKHHDVQECAG